MKASPKLIQALTVTLELTNTDLSDGAAKAILADLSSYPEPQVFGALKRCARELKGKLSLADILARIDDGRPGAEEAWAMIPKDEAGSVVWTTEMRDAYSVAYPLVSSGDLVAARMAFKERYTLMVQAGRDARHPVEWQFSPGQDKALRELALLDAAEKGRISVDGARRLLPHHREDETLSARLLAIASGAVKRLGAPA